MSQVVDFNEEFHTDEEVEEMFNNIISMIKETEDTGSKISIVNPNKVQEVLYTYMVLKYLTKGTNAKVTYELYAPFDSVGSVTVSGKNLAFRKPDWFIKAIELSSNFEVYPKTNGTVEMNFTFHGLMKPIKQEG